MVGLIIPLYFVFVKRCEALLGFECNCGLFRYLMQLFAILLMEYEQEGENQEVVSY